MNEEPEERYFDYGDRVRLSTNNLVCGQVIGERNWGQEFRVRIVGLLEPVWYENIEIEHDPEFTPARASVPESGAPAEATGSNIIDFLRHARTVGEA